MGTRRPYTLVDTTPAKTILVYRNGDPFYVGRKFVFSRRRVATFETLLDQLTEQVDVPFGVRRLYTPTRGRQVLELEALQAGGKYVAAGRERFKKLDYIHIVPRKPAKMRKLKEIKPVVHCDLNVPSRWQAYHRVSRHVNVFTNGRLFIPPVKIIIPKFCLSDWTHVLAVIGEKVFPLGGVRKLFTMTGHLLDSSEDLQDNHFYVAAGLETFKPVPYWKSPRVPSEVQLKFAADAEKHPQRKKKEDSKAKEPHPQDGLPPKTQDSVYYAKEGARPELAGPVVRSGAEGDVYTAPTPSKEARGAPEVKEDPCMQVEVPVDQAPAEMVGEDEEIRDDTSSLGGTEVKEEGRLYDDPERKEDYSRMCFKKKFPLRHNTKKKASLKSLSKNKKVVPVPEKVPHDVLEEKNTPVLPAENEAQTEPPRRQQSHELSPRQGQLSEEQASSEQSSQEQSSQEQLSEEQASQEQASQEQLSEEQEPPDQSSPRQPSQEQLPEEQEPPEQSPLGQPSQEHIPEKPKSPEQASLEQASQNK